MTPKTPPPRPSSLQERIASVFFFKLGPRLPRVSQPDPPDELRPWEHVEVERGEGVRPLTATWYPAERPRGAVLLLHPWLEWGKSYFHRRGRIEALRKAGYAALTLDLGGFGGGERRSGFLDRDVEAGLDRLRRLAPGLPLHVWGVSAGGYWSHVVLSRRDGVAGAMFEDVSPHLFEWSWRMAPLMRPAFFLFQRAFPASYRFLDIRLHAPSLKVAAASYVSGGRDRGVLSSDTRTLTEAAGGRCLIVPGAGHLGAIKAAHEEVVGLALDTFRRAEASLQAQCSPTFRRCP